MKQSSGSNSNNIQVGRDLILNLQKISKYLSEDIPIAIQKTLAGVDEKINELFPDGVYSMRSKDIMQRFDSSKMISSLGLIGIPIDVSFKVLEKTVEKIENYSYESKKLDALSIRQFVAHSIMTVETVNHSNNRIQMWSDFYIRRYGDPNHRIEIIQPDGGVEYLEQKYVESVVIKDVINFILKQTNFESFRKDISNTELHDMSREIVELITSINIYKIHYDTLLKISIEHALQPPHPWIVERAFDYKSVKYDYDKVQYHLEKLHQFIKRDDFGSIIYSLREIIHHSCSAILCHYGVFMGCGEFATLHNLYNLLVKISESNYDFENAYAKVNVLVSDIDKNNIDIHSFIKCLKNIRQRIHYSSESDSGKIKIYIELTEQLLNDYYYILLKSYIELNALKASFDFSKLTQYNLKTLIIDAINVLPFFKFEFDSDKSVWLSHSLNGGVFSLFKAKILFYCSFSDNILIHKDEINEAHKIVLGMAHVSNAFLIISNRIVSDDDKNDLRQLFSKGIFAAVISINDFIDIATNKDPEKHLRGLLNFK